MLIAVFVYYFVFYCSLDLTIKGSSLAELIVTRICILFTLLFIIFFTFNYQGIQSHIARYDNKLMLFGKTSLESLSISKYNIVYYSISIYEKYIKVYHIK